VHRRVQRTFRALVGVVLVLAVAGPARATPEQVLAAATSAVDDAQSRADDADQKLQAAEARVTQLEAERDDILAEQAKFTQQQRDLTAQLETARRDVRQLAVASYVSGGPAGNSGRLLEMSQISDTIWRAALIDGQTDLTVESAKKYAQLLGGADAAVRELVTRLDQNHAKLEQAMADRYQASVEEKASEQQLAAARARVANAFVAASDGSLSDAWARLRNCESSGNYQAVSPSGRYRGAYQFDLRTWEGVGGEGDPIDAPPAEQDMRARMLYERRGPSPWPVCGRFLP
jgi:exonuclease VII small subunit